MAEHHPCNDNCAHETDAECLAAGLEKIKHAARARRDPPTAAQKRAALAHLAPLSESPAVIVRPESPRLSPMPLLVALVGAAIILGILGLAGCATVPAEAVELAREQHAVEIGHAADLKGELTLETRQRGADSARAWDTEHVALTGERVPGAEVYDALLASPELAPLAPGTPRCSGDEMSGEPCGCVPERGPCEMPCTGCCSPRCICEEPPPSRDR